MPTLRTITLIISKKQPKSIWMLKLIYTKVKTYSFLLLSLDNNNTQSSKYTIDRIDLLL